MPLEPVKKREPMTVEDKAFNVRNDPVVQDMWINAIRNNTHIHLKLSSFYIDVFKTCRNMRARGLFLSEKQAELLEAIYSEI